MLHIFGENKQRTKRKTPPPIPHTRIHVQRILMWLVIRLSLPWLSCVNAIGPRARWSARYTGAIVINERRVFRGAPEGRNERAHGVYRHPNIHFPLPRSRDAATAEAAAVINDFCARAFAAGAMHRYEPVLPC